MIRRSGLAFLIALLFPVSFVHPQQILDQAVAIVNDDVILESEVTQGAYVLAMRLGIDPTKDPEKLSALRKEVMDNLIVQKVLLTRADEETVKVEDRQVESVLDEQMKTMVQQLGSEEKVEEYFGTPIKKLRRDYRDEIKNNLKVKNLRDQKVMGIKISRREAEEFFQTMKDSLPEYKESVDISHILLEIKPGEKAKNEALARITEILNRIKTGEDFADLAKRYSEDPGSAPKGGELGFLQRGDFMREFEEAAFALEPGQISDVVQTSLGYHIIQLIERRGEKINVRHILIRLTATEQDAQTALEEITQIHNKIVNGKADFSEMAKKYSNDQSTREEGGHLGWFEVEQLRETSKEFTQVLDTVKVGEVSEPFRTRFGYHILKLNERREGRKLSLSEDWDKIEAMALDLKRQKEFEKWVDRLKKDQYIEIKVDE